MLNIVLYNRIITIIPYICTVKPTNKGSGSDVYRTLYAF